MGAPRILVVDDDAWILRMVSTVLEKRGYQITTAGDGEEAWNEAVKQPPDLVISDVMMPKMDGWSLVKRLRSRPEFAFVPFIFLTALGSDEDRIRGFRLGADDYLPKPFRFEELDLRVANALKRRAQVESSVRAPAAATSGPAAVATTEAPGFRGSLDQIGLPSLLMLVEMERKSGLLVLTTEAPAETGRLFVHLGRVVRASIDGQPAPRNKDAIYRMIGWDRGRFEFSAFEVQMEDEIGLPTTHLVMEGARRLDESRRPPDAPPR